MDNPVPQVVPDTQRRWPAWTFSLLVHASWISLLALAVESAPRGAAEEAGRTAGIVLKHASAEGDLYEGEEDRAPQETSTSAEAPDELIAALPTESESFDVGADLPQLPRPGAGATTAGGGSEMASGGGGGGSGSLGGGGNTRTSIFGVEGIGTKFVYVFDQSSSMEGAPLASAKKQLLESLESLEEIHQFHIIFFSSEPTDFKIPHSGGRMAYANDQNKRLAAKFIGGITAYGGTDRYAALRKAVTLQPDVIFFLTDADDPMSLHELDQIERANRRAHAAICVIEFGRRATAPTDNFLVQLARASGGQYGYVNTNRLAQ